MPPHFITLLTAGLLLASAGALQRLQPRLALRFTLGRQAQVLAPGAPAPSYPLAANEMLLCQNHACADMRLEIPGWSLDTPALVVESTVLSKRALIPDIIELVDVVPNLHQNNGRRPGD